MNARWLFLVGILLGGALFAGCLGQAGDEQLPAAELAGFQHPVAGIDLSGFQRADGSQPPVFPQDFGPHPDYQTEWWYYTGNLQTEDGHRFGYQLTFFRRALAPPTEIVARPSDWATGQVYMAHFAVSDMAGEQHYAFERFSRGAAGLAGAQGDPYQVWLEDWQVAQLADGSYRLQAQQAEISLDLNLRSLKAPVLHGQQGYSQKGPEPGNASYYYSQTRLESRGQVSIHGTSYLVQGLSWKDHEYSTSALSVGQVGWDWFSIQLDAGLELMVFQIRRADGSLDPYSSGTLVYPDGSLLHLAQADFNLAVLDTWRSPHSGAEYPSGWRLQVLPVGLELVLQPAFADQEMQVSYFYWEGAVAVTGQWGDQVVAGSGYVELTGYVASMEGEF